MAVALSEFWTRLVRNGVTDASGCKRYAAGYAEKTGGLPPDDAVSLAKYLVKTGALTPFQAKSLLGSEAVPILHGRYLQTALAAAVPLSRWLPVVRQEAGSAKPAVGVLFRTTPEQLSGGRDQWVAAHAGVTSDTLQSIELDSVDDNIVVYSPLPSGASLSASLKAGAKLSPKKACEIAIAVCDALAALHASSLWHGEVRTDRVWIGKDGSVRLLRDPSGPAVSPQLENPFAWLDRSESPTAYAAPELTDPSAACSAASDIYSLGCLIYRLVIGELPFSADSPAEMMSQHATVTPAPIAAAVAAGESGDPLLRVVAFAMARNPASRFATVSQFADALRATATMIESAAAEPAAAEPTSSSRPVVTETVAPALLTPTPAPAPAPAIRTQSEAESAETPVVAIDRDDSPASQSHAPPVAVSEPSEPDSSPSLPRRRRRKRKSNKAPFILGGLCVAVLMLMIMLLVGGTGKQQTVTKKRTRPPVPDRVPSVTGASRNSETKQPAKSAGVQTPSDTLGYQVVDDDRLLWLPPFATETSAPLSMLPPGPAVIVSVNLASLRSNPKGALFLDSLAPDLQGLLDQSVARAKVPIEKMNRLSMAMHKGKEGWPEVSLAVTLREPTPLDSLVKAWDVSASRTPEGVTLYAGDEVDSDAYFVGDVDANGNRVTAFAVASIARTKEVAENAGANILLPRSMQSLWDATSAETDFVVIATPNFLFADARNLLLDGAPRLVAPLKSFLIPNVAAAMMLAHFDDERLYAEVRLSPSGGISEASLMKHLNEAVDATPQWAKDFVLDAVPDSSWRLLANQLPAMMSFLSRYARYGVADRAAIGNAYLPADAASQITLATLFAINTTGNATGVVAATASKKTLTVEELLSQKMSVTFEQESLEFGIDIIAEQFAAFLPEGTEVPPMRIIGGDLQKMGITQNQQIRGFAKKDMPFRQVLTDLLLGANPDKTATGSHDAKQALVWVVADDPTRPGKKELLVTTRQAAEGKYELPAEFVLQP
ncbi:Serine/threonine-protein kinase PknB [Novipirellula galeiformis]|uniref:non-specific serine/threonine protein kinase n=1 Tax=Novipirellula galeiformis TaxID=2528004 RepID=A0A5C6CAX8_9BACT|nr:protein kinase [Novipirellula galeiformis]TWU20581.1 Serine/threonine-protein kinase PknB [Novipirellula galeiformis]